jgi:hypothetical protein
MVKAAVAKHSPFLIFTKLSPEQGARLASHLSDDRFFPGERLVTLLGRGEARTIGFDEAVDYFEQFFAESAAKLMPDLRILRTARNASVHFVLPEFQAYELVRAAYVALGIHDAIVAANAKGAWFWRFPGISEKHRKVAAGFNGEKANLVRQKLRDAAAKAVALRNHSFILVDGPDVTELTCPVCGNDGIATGSRELDHPNEWAGIWCQTFSCDECGLELADSGELEIAGINPLKEVHYSWRDAPDPDAARKRGG